ncbi:hypothetical protein ACHAXT_008120 [Thalassiosira profunda]
MADVQRPEGQFPRLNHALLQAGNYSNQIASFVGKAVNFDGQATLTFECADGGKVTMQVSPEFAFEPGKYVEVMGSVNEDKTVQTRKTLALDGDAALNAHKLSDHFEMEDGGYSDDDASDDSSTGSGWLLGTVCLAAVSTGNVYAMLLLVKCRKRLEANGYIGIKGYGDLGREIMGPRGEVLVNVCLVVSQMGFATAYLIFIAANFQSITSGKAGRAAIIFGCVPILSLLVQFRDMKKLSPFSLVADVSNLMGLSCVIFQDFEYYTHSDTIKAFDFAGIVYVTSVCIYSLEGVALVLPLESSCANREGFPKLLKKVILGITAMMAFFGTCGYVAFGEGTVSPISLNLKGESAAFVQMALCLAIYLTYPIMMFPVSDVLENLFLSEKNSPPRRYCPSRTFRMGMVLTTAIIAYTIPNFGKFLELVGASICTLLGFILPCLFHMKVFGRSELKLWEQILDVSIIILGVFFGAVGTIEAIVKLMEDDEELVLDATNATNATSAIVEL